MSLRSALYAFTESFVALGLWHMGVLRNLQRRRVIRILAYHNVSEEADPVFGTSRETFVRQMAFLAQHYQVVSLDDACDMLAGSQPWAERAVVITFDDGYEDNYRIAWPVLRKLQLPATIFLTTDYIGSRAGIWLNRLHVALRRTGLTKLSASEILGEEAQELPLRTPAQRFAVACRLVDALYSVPPRERVVLTEQIIERLEVDLSSPGPAPTALRMLSWDQAREMAAGGLITFASHGCSHSILSRLTDESLYEELSLSKTAIERELGRQVRHFAYPNGMPGDWDERAPSQLANLGYASAVTMQQGLATDAANPFELPRVGYRGAHGPTFAKRLEDVRLRGR